MDDRFTFSRTSVRCRRLSQEKKEKKKETYLGSRLIPPLLSAVRKSLECSSTRANPPVMPQTSVGAPLCAGVQ
jgi:hypothetical protein